MGGAHAGGRAHARDGRWPAGAISKLVSVTGTFLVYASVIVPATAVAAAVAGLAR